MPHRAIRGAPATSSEALSPYSAQLTRLELASGLVFGEDPDAQPLPEDDPSLDPVEALGQAIVPYLERPPCLVSFSGGRDSSVLLAVATAVARREGLELPVPITQRFPNVPESDESDWQELVIGHVKPPDWQRQIVTDEFDFLGPSATSLLLRHGVLWPSAQGVLPMLRQARGGTLLTGFDGDSLFRTWRWARAASILARRVRPAPRDALRVALAFAPEWVRAWRLQRQMPFDHRWLEPDAREVVRRAFFEEAAGEPFRWDRYLPWLARRRYLAVVRQTHRLVSEGTGATIAHPFFDARFLASLLRAGGALGFGDATQFMGAHFSSLLPDAVLARTDKASFDQVAWGPHSRRFIAAWCGGPVRVDFVDARGLLETWRQPRPHAASAAVLQALWLSLHRPSVGVRPNPLAIDADTRRG